MDVDYTLFNGTSLQGYVTATYDELVEIFGEPALKAMCVDNEEYCPEDKIATEWYVIGEDWNGQATPCTIYDWKDYDAGATSRSGRKYEWHIGGKSKIAVENILRKMGRIE